MDWKARGWGGKNANQIIANITDSNGKAMYKIYGKYIDKINLVNLET